MSASLVGSEMCIRDRSTATVLQWRQFGRAATLPSVMGPSTFRPVPFAPPVSYTHLTLPTICSV
eukprot:14260021-Alexandrium_andersonii.AAC.1